MKDEVRPYYRDYIMGKSPRITGPCISHFMITVPDVFVEVQLVQNLWMTWQKLVRQIIWATKGTG